MDANSLDKVIGEWLLDLTKSGELEDNQLVVAVDGKSLRGAVQDDGRPVHLFAAMVQGNRTVIAQNEVEHKTNEITGFAPLLRDLDLKDAVVTADAMHAQKAHAKFLVEENQLSLLKAIKTLKEESFSP